MANQLVLPDQQVRQVPETSKAELGPTGFAAKYERAL